MSIESIDLSIGDRIPAFNLPSQTGEVKEIGDFVGKPMMICFFPSAIRIDCTALLSGLQQMQPQYRQLGIECVAIGPDSVDLHQAIAAQYGLTFPILSDGDRQVSTAYGVTEATHLYGTPSLTSPYTTFITDRNYRVIKTYRNFDPFTHAQQVLIDVNPLLYIEEPRQILQQAPVLLIPNVLDLELCQQLIELWHTENGESGFMRQVDGKTVALMDNNHKIRRDHFMKPSPIKERIKQLLGRKVTPEIWKAHHFNATRIEDFRIVCYDSSKGGFFRPHRDNTTAGTAHRVFAMTINLNAGEYEGGCLRFPEYGPHLYRPNTGSAVIFSCSLLHEATDVMGGRRFALLSFLYGEEEARRRAAYQQASQQSAVFV